MACLSKYGEELTDEVYRQHFPARGRTRLYPNLEAAIIAETPTLQLWDRVYGEGKSEKWVRVQIREVLAFAGVREMFNDYQIETTAEVLKSMCVPLAITMSELMVFFTRFEQGMYKSFVGYNHPNPQVILESFKTFTDELMMKRGSVYDKMRQAEVERKANEAAEQAVPCPDHIKQHLDKLFAHFAEAKYSSAPKRLRNY